jgi:5-methylcytosine-specific restriction endonuclease McrA
MARVLRLNSSGIPTAWISREDAAVLYAKNQVAWEYGKIDNLMFGGTQKNGHRSCMEMCTVIAIRGQSKIDARPRHAFNNRMLFRRDNYRCMYCGYEFSSTELTRDHVVPRAKGGKDRWENVVAACKRCNHQKADKLLEDIDMSLLAIPFRPNIFESMFLAQRTVLEDQMEYLEKQFSGRRNWIAA